MGVEAVDANSVDFVLEKGSKVISRVTSSLVTGYLAKCITLSYRDRYLKTNFKSLYHSTQTTGA